MRCKHCGNEFPAERAELGYDYCTAPACVEACLEPLNVVAVHVNKASDQYVLREQLGIPEHKTTRTIDPGWAPLFAAPATVGHHRAGAPTTVEVINALEAELDNALAQETDPESRNKLVNDFNARLRRFDIRYRRIRQRRPT